jgi:peptidoglycan/xylan/chitin deacetylase (PgdA/CDA1 family)
MSSRTGFYKLALNSLYYSGAHRALKGRFGGVGALLTLHHVQPDRPEHGFSPNRILAITPEFLDQTIRQIVALGYDIVSLSELHRRFQEGDFRRPFVSFTLDDGYADNYTYAFPIFRKHQIPFAIYVCTGLMDGSVDQWWRTLEEIVRQEKRIEVELDGIQRVFTATTTRQECRTFDTIYWALRRMPLELQLSTMRSLRERYVRNHDGARIRAPVLTWEMIAQMDASGLLTVGAHTVNHFALAKLSDDEARGEMSRSSDLIERQTGKKPEHFAYPYGDASSAAQREFKMAEQLGFLTAVSTRKGVLFPEHAEHLHALPRISLNGDYQQARNVEMFLSGLPFALFRGFRKLDVD